MDGRCPLQKSGMPLLMPFSCLPRMFCEQIERRQTCPPSWRRTSVASRRSGEAHAPVLIREDGLSGARESSYQDKPCSAPAASTQKNARGHLTSSTPSIIAIGTVLLAALSCSNEAALAATHAEPSNALSVPTWIIHVSSVIEWTTAMLLMWRYAEVTGNEKWKGMTWGMMPLFSGALCACTYHFFYNTTQLDFLVTLQASLTWIGNATLWAAAYRIFKDDRSAA